MTDQHDSLPTDALARLLRDASPSGFEHGFADRVQSRLLAERTQTLPRALEHYFIRVVPLAAAATLILAAYNWWGARDTSSSVLDAALNLPQVSVASAYSSSSLFSADESGTGTP